MKSFCPLARKKSLIIKELVTETLVYDLENDKAHCLNDTAARVWKNCNGRNTVSQLRALLETEIKAPVSEDVAWLALDQLEKFKQLETTTADKPLQLAGVSRRELVRRIGMTALALPLIFSIVAPTAQAQGSLLTPGSCCNNPTQCASNSCNQSPTCIGIPGPSTKACA